MPQSTDADGIVRLKFVVQLLRLPIPDKQLSVRIARYQITATAFKNQNLITYSQQFQHSQQRYCLLLMSTFMPHNNSFISLMSILKIKKISNKPLRSKI